MWVRGVLVQMSCSPTWVSTLCQRSPPPLQLLPLWGSAPLPGASACLTPVCWSPRGVVLEGSCCATWVSPMCRALPQGLQRALLSMLQVHLGFSGHRVSVLLLPG